MRKSISDELKYKVISLWYQGYTRDDIASTTGIGKGTVSNILKEFREKMKKGDFEAIQIHARLNRELNVDHEKMLDGHRTNQILEKNEITKEQLNSVIENCGKVIKSDANLSSLAKAAVEILNVKKRTGQSIDEISKIYQQESSEVIELKNEKNSLQQEIHNAIQQKQSALDDADATQEILDEFVKARDDSKDAGFSIWDILNSTNVIQEFANLGFDAKEIILFFHKLQGLEKAVNTLEAKKQNLEQEIIDKQTHLQQLTKDLDTLDEKYKKYSKAIKTVQKFIDSNQEPDSIIDWEKTLKSAGVDVATFDNKLNEYCGIVSFLRELLAETENLKNHKEQLIFQINSFVKRIQELKNDEETMERKIEQQIARVSEQISQYENSNPLAIIRGPNCDPVRANQIIVIYFKELKKYAASFTVEPSDAQSHLDSLIGYFEQEGNSHSK